MEIYVLDTDLSTVGILSNYNSFIWTERYEEAGDFQIDLPASEYHINLLQHDRYLKISDSNEIMVIEDISIKTENKAQKMTVTGRSLISILDRRVILGTKYFNDAQQEAENDKNLWEIASILVDENAIIPEQNDLTNADQHISAYSDLMAQNGNKRKIKNLQRLSDTYYITYKDILDPDGKILKKKPLNLQFNGETLYDGIKSLCNKYHIGFTINDFSKFLGVQTDSPFVFYLYDGRDLSDSVILSPTFENIANISYVHNKNGYKNMALAIGDEMNESEPINYQAWAIVDTEGHYVNNHSSSSVIANIKSDLELRESILDLTSQVTHDGDSASGEPYDLDDKQYYRALCLRAYETLKEQNKALEAFDGELVNGDKTYKIKEDYDLGDIISMSDDLGHSKMMRVTEVIYSYNASGYKIYPTLALYENDEYQQRDET